MAVLPQPNGMLKEEKAMTITRIDAEARWSDVVIHNQTLYYTGVPANLDADAVPVSVANMPRNGVSAHGLVHRAAVSPVGNPLRHRRIIAHSLPVLYVIPCGRSLVRRGMHYKVLRL